MYPVWTSAHYALHSILQNLLDTEMLPFDDNELLSRGAGLGYFEAQSRQSLRLNTFYHLSTEAVKTKL